MSANDSSDKSPIEQDAQADRTTSSHRTHFPEPNVALLQKALDGQWPEAREEVRNKITEEMLPELDIDRTAYRDKVLRDLKTLADGGFAKAAFKEEDSGTGETGKALTAFEMLGMVDLSTMVKAGVQWGLWGGAVSNLGGKEIRQKYLPGTIDLSVVGCFAMTEIGGGSDVQNLTTEATFDTETQEFVINSPTPAAQKAYIGGAARDAQYAAVFAQLITKGPDDAEAESNGVHCFVVQIRDDEGNDLPGVTTGDHGPKGGLPGVDNGTIIFDHVRIPKSNLLNRFGDVKEDGTYTSPIESPGRRFFTMLGTLVQGRVSLDGSAIRASQLALHIAITYATQRRQFSAADPKIGRAHV